MLEVGGWKCRVRRAFRAEVHYAVLTARRLSGVSPRFRRRFTLKHRPALCVTETPRAGCHITSTLFRMWPTMRRSFAARAFDNARQRIGVKRCLIQGQSAAFQRRGSKRGIRNLLRRSRSEFYTSNLQHPTSNIQFPEIMPPGGISPKLIPVCPAGR